MATDDTDETEKKDESEPEAEKPAAEKPTEADAHASPHGSDDEEEVLIAEPDRVNVGIIGAVTLAIVVATVAVVVGVQQFFTQTIQGEVGQKVHAPEDPARKNLALVEQAKLTKYQWVNQKDGLVRIPKDRARELVLAEYAKMPAYQPGAPAAPPTPPEPEPAPAPSTSVEPGTSASVAPSASVPPAPSGSVAPPAPSASGSAHPH